jgi:SAM-dependent methyltransferase
MIRELFWMLQEVKRTAETKPQLWLKDLQAWRRFWRSYQRYNQLSGLSQPLSLNYLYPCLGDDIKETPIEPIYFYQDAWAFEKIVKRQPAFHIDVGSHFKFVALLSKVIKVTMVDIRPLSLPLDTLEFREGSIAHLPFEDASAPSVSSLCVVEHIGLGRYGDPLDPFGTEKAIDELKRIVQPGGDLYLSVPLDNETRVCFNAHRTFREDYLMQLFKPFQVREQRYIYGREFGEHIKPGFGTGCYHLKRLV